MLSNIQYDSLVIFIFSTIDTCPYRLSCGQPVINCVGLSSAVFKICGQRLVNVSYNLRSEIHCMQSVVCSLQSAAYRPLSPVIAMTSSVRSDTSDQRQIQMVHFTRYYLRRRNTRYKNPQLGTQHCLVASFWRCFPFFTLLDQLDQQQKHLLRVEEMRRVYWLICRTRANLLRDKL